MMGHPMSIRFLQCTHCSAPLDPATAVGGMIRCTYCRSTFQLDTPPAAAPSVAGSTGRVRAVLESFPGNRKIHAIKAVREATGMGLKESKELVESVPAVVGDLSPAKAERLEKDIAELGGVVKFTQL